MSELQKPYSYSVLRYVHDIVTEEFVNVGVILYSPPAGIVRIMCSATYSRLSAFFGEVEGLYYRRLIRHIEGTVIEMQEHLFGGLPLTPPPTLSELTARILPPDDSALRFSKPGGGISSDMSATLTDLYERLVECYTKKAVKPPTRSDQEVLKVFKSRIRGEDLAWVTRPITIKAPRYEHEFPWAWTNGKLNACQALSFDLVDPDSILDKAHNWVGKIQNLSASETDFTVNFLLGEPSNPSLRPRYEDARATLADLIPSGRRRIFGEDESSEFAEIVQREASGEGS